jgi:hypothetical protein
MRIPVAGILFSSSNVLQLTMHRNARSETATHIITAILQWLGKAGAWQKVIRRITLLHIHMTNNTKML